MSTTNYSSLAYIKESVPGETPATPAFLELPITSIGLVEAITTAMDETIRSDRMIDDLSIVDADIGGDNEFSLSYKAYKPKIISLLQCGETPSTIVSILSDITISVVAATNSFDSGSVDFVAAGVIVGMWIDVSGFSNTANNGLHRVSAVTSGSITIDSNISTLVDESAGPSVDIVGETYRNSNQVPEDYTYRQIVVNKGVTYYAYYKGQEVNSMTFNLATGAIITGTMNLVGLTAVMQSSPIAGETTIPYDNYRIMNSVSNLAVVISGLPATTVYETFDLTILNNVNAKKGIAKLGGYELGSFSNEVTAEVDMYFEDLSAYNLFKSSGSFLSAFQMTDPDGNKIVATIPACKFESLEMPIPGKDEFLMQNGTIRGVRDTVTNCQIQFDFIDAS